MLCIHWFCKTLSVSLISCFGIETLQATKSSRSQSRDFCTVIEMPEKICSGLEGYFRKVTIELISDDQMPHENTLNLVVDVIQFLACVAMSYSRHCAHPPITVSEPRPRLLFASDSS